jgi:hypothetical protein
MFSSFPGRKVVPGETWDIASTTDMGPLGRYETSHACTYEGPDGKLARIKVATTGKFRAADKQTAAGGLPFRIVEGDLHAKDSGGSLWFDPQKGRLDHYELHLRFEGQLTLEIGGQATKVDLSQTQKMTGKFADSQLGLLGPGIYYDSIENK